MRKNNKQLVYPIKKKLYSKNYTTDRPEFEDQESKDSLTLIFVYGGVGRIKNLISIKEYLTSKHT